MRDTPWADIAAFCTAQAQVIGNEGQTIYLFVGSTERTEVSAWRILAMHTPTGYVEFILFALVCDFSGLQKEPVIRGELIFHILFVRPVFDFDATSRDAFRIWFGGDREFVCVGFAATADTFAAADTFGKIKQGRKLIVFWSRSSFLGDCH